MHLDSSCAIAQRLDYVLVLQLQAYERLLVLTVCPALLLR